MLVVEYDDQLLIIDCGLMFPESDMLGIDIVIPDMSYVFERADRVRAIIVTHGHEDHTGGLPYLLEKVKAPIYATRLTRGLIEVKLKEYHHIEDADLHTVAASRCAGSGPFFRRVLPRMPLGPRRSWSGHHHAGRPSRTFGRFQV